MEPSSLLPRSVCGSSCCVFGAATAVVCDRMTSCSRNLVQFRARGRGPFSADPADVAELEILTSADPAGAGAGLPREAGGCVRRAGRFVATRCVTDRPPSLWSPEGRRDHHLRGVDQASTALTLWSPASTACAMPAGRAITSPGPTRASWPESNMGRADSVRPAAAQSTIPKAIPAAGAPPPRAPPARTDGAARFVPSAPCATAFREQGRPDREAQARQPQDRLAHLRGLVKEGRLVDRSLAPARRRQVIWRAHGDRFAGSLS